MLRTDVRTENDYRKFCKEILNVTVGVLVQYFIIFLSVMFTPLPSSYIVPVKNDDFLLTFNFDTLCRLDCVDLKYS